MYLGLFDLVMGLPSYSMGFIIIFNKYSIFLSIESNNFLQNSDIITLNQAFINFYISINMQLTLIVVFNYFKYMNFLILMLQSELMPMTTSRARRLGGPFSMGSPHNFMTQLYNELWPNWAANEDIATS